jgi:hypothetical protein
MANSTPITQLKISTINHDTNHDDTEITKEKTKLINANVHFITSLKIESNNFCKLYSDA